MSTHPFIPLYVDDYDAATAHLTPEEDGVYSRLIRLCWRTPGCSLPNDAAWIARKIRLSAADYERVAQVVIDEFFTLSRGRLIQRRLKREYDNISRKQTARKLAGKKGGDAKARKTLENVPSIATDLPVHAGASPEPEPEPEPEREDIGGGARESATITKQDWPEGDIVDALVKAVASPFLDPQKSHGLITTSGMLAAWKRDGASWTHDIVPVVTGLCAKQRSPIKSWKFFKDAIERSMAERLCALAMPDPSTLNTQRKAHGSPSSSKLDAKAANHARAFAAVDVAVDFLDQRR